SSLRYGSCCPLVFFFKQKTAYELFDWSSDVCSSDLRRPLGRARARSPCCAAASLGPRFRASSPCRSTSSGSGKRSESRRCRAERSEERRVGKESRVGLEAEREKKRATVVGGGAVDDV